MAEGNGTQTTLSDMRKDLTTVANLPNVTVGFGSLQSFEMLQRAGTMLSKSTLMPKAFQGNVANCALALNMAQRIGADPLMVAQNLYIVHGNPSWSAKFLVATFNECGRFSAIRFRFQGTEGQDDWGCRAWAVELATKQEIVGALITIALAKAEKWYDKPGSKWQTMPEQMLMYRSAAWLVNTHAPELSMGLNTREELEDAITLEPGSDGTYAARTEDLRREMDRVDAEISGQNGNGAGDPIDTTATDKGAGGDNPDEPEANPDIERAATLIAELEALCPGAGQKTFSLCCGDDVTMDEVSPEKLAELIAMVETSIKAKKSNNAKKNPSKQGALV